MVRVDEFDDFMRFVERCFGHSKGFFTREFPHIYQPDPESCSYGHVVEKGGKIVSHVGVYPIHTVVAGISIPVGGIGAVSTAPEERGKDHMTRLLRHVSGVMREQGFLVSGLGGDRQRYNTFGWEPAGLTYSLRFSRRTLDRAKVKPAIVRDVYADEAIDTIAKFQSKTACHARRPRLALQLQKQRLRFFVAADGYAIGYGENWGPFSIAELVSASGQEAAMLRAIMDRTNGGEVHWTLSSWDREILARVMECAGGWDGNVDWQYKIVNLAGLLAACTPILQQHAAGLRDTDVSIGMREPGCMQNVRLVVKRGKIEVVPNRKAKVHVELDPVSAVRLVLGGPPLAASRGVPPVLATLFPVPVHVPPLDHV